ncbi:MAG: hypothetical protein WBB01_06435 [Phormidesmis sp.]
MSQRLQDAIDQLDHLTLEEQWKLLGHLINRLQSTVCFTGENQLDLQPPIDETDVNALLAETRGSWGNRSIEEIDADLNRQREMNWGGEGYR